MIRPLEYCVTSEHVRTSLNTIDERIREMLVLRHQYIEKLVNIEQDDNLLDVLEENQAFTEKIKYHIEKKTMKNKKVLVIDNYDSFTYNLVHLLQELGRDYEVVRNDKFDLDFVEDFEAILLSPGPGIPEEAGLLMDVIRRYGPTKKILGICLGQQAIAEVYGGTLYNMPKPLHGVATDIIVTDPNEKLFQGYPVGSKIGRYHSWAVEKDNLPECLKVTALDPDGVIMALTHTEYDVKAMQFHPESILTENGKLLIENWLS